MAGDSRTSLPRKLGIAEGSRVVLVGAPEGFAELLGVPLLAPRARNLDVVVFFVTRAADLERRFEALAGRLHPAGGLWIGWPKRASGVETDLIENTVRDIGLGSGALVDNKVAALDETWSGLRFVVRTTRRDNWPPDP